VEEAFISIVIIEDGTAIAISIFGVVLMRTTGGRSLGKFENGYHPPFEEITYYILIFSLPLISEWLQDSRKDSPSDF
jgi:hypothetical protein